MARAGGAGGAGAGAAGLLGFQEAALAGLRSGGDGGAGAGAGGGGGFGASSGLLVLGPGLGLPALAAGLAQDHLPARAEGGGAGEGGGGEGARARGVFSLFLGGAGAGEGADAAPSAAGKEVGLEAPGGSALEVSKKAGGWGTARPLALFLGATDAQRRAMEAELSRTAASGGGGGLPIVREVTAELPSAERQALYLRGGALHVTARILTVDLLARRLAPAAVTGVVFLNAHRATEASGEAFTVRLLREGGFKGYVRALSDQPYRLGFSFGKLERVMKALHLRRLLLWPRFEARVADCLEKSPPEVVTVALELTESLNAVQSGLADAMAACLKELRKCRHLEGVDLSVEGALFKSLGEHLRTQLDPVWHTVGRKTRQVVSDLQALRKLASAVLRYDAVSFLQHLEVVRATEGAHSVWLFLDAAHVVFEEAKQRVYRTRRTEGGRGERDDGGSPGGGVHIEPVLEPLPKWEVLRGILEESQAERRKILAACGPGTDAACGPSPSHRILIVTRDKHTALQLHQYLQVGAPQLMCALFEGYLEWRQGRAAARAAERGRPSKRRRQDAGARAMVGAAGAVAPSEREALRSREALREAEELARAATEAGGAGTAASMDASLLLDGTHFYTTDLREFTAILQRVRPAFVVLYDPDPESVRELEVFKALYPACLRRVYFMCYEGSLEEHRFKADVDRETRAFRSLIEKKSSMNVPVDSDGRWVVEASREPRDPRSSLAGLTPPKPGPGGMGLASRARKRVVVDMREFMSTLPSTLHLQGLELVPCTLEVGDYILSPELCVERKALPDLIASFASGRLHTQCTAMCRHYAIPILLIEFSGDKAFQLQGYDLGSDISILATGSKIALLTLHFPRLRLVWSRSQRATAEIFEALKVHHEDPRPDEAAAVGSRAAEDEGLPQNEAAVAFLKKLPGVTEANHRAVMREAGSLAGLPGLPLGALQRATGGRKSGKALHDFLHTPLASMLP